MRNTGLEEAQAGIKITGGNIKNLRYADDTTFMAENEEDTCTPMFTEALYAIARIWKQPRCPSTDE